MQYVDETLRVETFFDTERPRLVRLCSSLSGDHDAAEDLAQETLIEAWRHRHALTDPSGYAPWLSAIARNVCLRWQRQRGRTVARCISLSLDTHHDLATTWVDHEADVDVELEREELATLLDRALALLPPPTRIVLIARYMEQTPQADIAARFGISEGAVEARLHRGKLTLRRVLNTQLSEEAAAFGLSDMDTDATQETRIWCALCGQSRLVGHFDALTGELALGCPSCCPARDGFSRAVLPSVFSGINGYRAALSRQMAWADQYFRDALAQRTAPCVHCGSAALVQLGPPAGTAAAQRNTHGFHLRCVACAQTAWTSRAGLALNLPVGRRFWRQHQRIYQLPDREVDLGGRSAVVIGYQAMRDRSRLDVITTRDTFELIQVVVTSGG